MITYGRPVHVSPNPVPDFHHTRLLVKVAEAGAGVLGGGIGRHSSTPDELAVTPAVRGGTKSNSTFIENVKLKARNTGGKAEELFPCDPGW